MWFDIGSRYLGCRGQTTSGIQNKEVSSTLYLQAALSADSCSMIGSDNILQGLFFCDYPVKTLTTKDDATVTDLCPKTCGRCKLDSIITSTDADELKMSVVKEQLIQKINQIALPPAKGTAIGRALETVFKSLFEGSAGNLSGWRRVPETTSVIVVSDGLTWEHGETDMALFLARRAKLAETGVNIFLAKMAANPFSGFQSASGNHQDVAAHIPSYFGDVIDIKGTTDVDQLRGNVVGLVKKAACCAKRPPPPDRPCTCVCPTCAPPPTTTPPIACCTTKEQCVEGAGMCDMHTNTDFFIIVDNAPTLLSEDARSQVRRILNNVLGATNAVPASSTTRVITFRTKTKTSVVSLDNTKKASDVVHDVMQAIQKRTVDGIRLERAMVDVFKLTRKERKDRKDKRRNAVVLFVTAGTTVRRDVNFRKRLARFRKAKRTCVDVMAVGDAGKTTMNALGFAGNDLCSLGAETELQNVVKSTADADRKTKGFLADVLCTNVANCYCDDICFPTTVTTLTTTTTTVTTPQCPCNDCMECLVDDHVDCQSITIANSGFEHGGPVSVGQTRGGLPGLWQEGSSKFYGGIGPAMRGGTSTRTNNVLLLVRGTLPCLAPHLGIIRWFLIQIA